MGYQPKPNLITFAEILIILGITKTGSNNRFVIQWARKKKSRQ